MDVVITNSWMEYKLDSAQSKIEKKYEMDLLKLLLQLAEALIALPTKQKLVGNSGSKVLT